MLAGVAVGCRRADKNKAAAPASGTLEVASLPKAEVSIDGKVVGETPLTRTVAAGAHQIVVRSKAFLDRKAAVRVDAGQTTKLDYVLEASDPTDPLALVKLARAFEVGAWSEIGAPQAEHRGGRDEGFVTPIYPRGSVRLEDLRQYRIDVGVDFDHPGKLRFKHGSKVLFEKPFDPEELSTEAPFPAEVLKQLKPGERLTWGFYPSKGKATTTRFKVVKMDAHLAKRVARMEARLDGQPELTLCQMRAQLYLNKKLYLAAYFEGRRALELAEATRPPPPHALAVMQDAARRMHLEKTPLWDEIQGDLGRIPDRVKQRQARTGRSHH